jgi:hypothetical protein
MSTLRQKRTLQCILVMHALPPKRTWFSTVVMRQLECAPGLGVAKLDEDKPGVITHWCDTIGESGAPILLFKGNDASIIGIHSSIVYDFDPQLGHKPLFGEAVSSAEVQPVLVKKLK